MEFFHDVRHYAFKGVDWDVNFETVARQEYHKKKMASKIERPAKQLALFGDILAVAIVQHIAC